MTGNTTNLARAILQNSKKKARVVVPTENQKKVFGIVAEDIRKGEKISISKAMKKSGVYSKSMTAHPEKITRSKGWQALLDQHLPDSLITKKTLGLLNQKKLDYFVFPKGMSDEEITEHVEGAGLKVITIRFSDKGKMAFYSIDDAVAISNGLDFASKFKGKYAPEKHMSVVAHIDVTKKKKIDEILGLTD